MGAILQAASYEVAQLLVGRVIAGIGLGVCRIPFLSRSDANTMKLVVSNVIMWQTEISPSRVRGLLVSSALTFLILGDVRGSPPYCSAVLTFLLPYS